VVKLFEAAAPCTQTDTSPNYEKTNALLPAHWLAHSRWCSARLHASLDQDILVPTLKGCNFDQLYDLRGIRYLDATRAFTTLAFIWLALAVFRWARKQIAAA
jgi:hypothetical protein